MNESIKEEEKKKRKRKENEKRKKERKKGRFGFCNSGLRLRTLHFWQV